MNHKTRVIWTTLEPDVVPVSCPQPVDVTTRPSAEDGSWRLNFEKRTSRKRTSRASKVTHLPHHPTTPTVRPASPAQNHACAPEGGNAGPSCRLVPLGTLGVASRVPVARGTSGESPVALCINRWCRRSHHVRHGAYFASCCDLLGAPVPGQRWFAAMLGLLGRCAPHAAQAPLIRRQKPRLRRRYPITRSLRIRWPLAAAWGLSAEWATSRTPASTKEPAECLAAHELLLLGVRKGRQSGV